MVTAFVTVDGLLTFMACVMVIYAASFMLDIPRKGPFWVTELAVVVLALLVWRQWGSTWGFSTFIAGYVVALLAFSRDVLSRRLLIAVCLTLIFVVSEALYIVCTHHIYALAGVESLKTLIVSREDLISMDRSSTVLNLVLCLSACRLMVILGLVALFEVARRRMSSRRTDQGAWVFGAFMALQLFMMMVSVMLLSDAPLRSMPSWYLTGLMVVMVVSALIDVLAFMYLDLYNARIHEEEQAAALQEELDRSLLQYEAVEKEIRIIAALRHDLRNQAAVVSLLAEEGDTVRARSHVDLLVEQALARSAEAWRQVDEGGSR